MDEKISNKDELIKQATDSFFILMKFGSKENLEKLQQGKVYMKNLDYYINLENETSNEDVGDKFDGLMPIHDLDISILNPETNEPIHKFKANMATMNLGLKKSPVMCMYILDYRNFTNADLNDDILSIEFTFTDEQKERISKFGDSVLLIKNTQEFFERMERGLVADKASFSRDRVKYYNKNILQHFQEVAEDYRRIAFWKRKKYEHQQEYRFLVLNKTVEDHYTFDIEDLSDISEIVPTEVILNTVTEVRHKIGLIEE
ncbi:hypothetical protein PRVXT_002497 [Proteinivorax tanatarense]|uniref:Uncharacterized protein n=1 Tax=Proteinivorax tanatarense TaxID=1260629 RepID=A0AAU7VK18_9FIRM